MRKQRAHSTSHRRTLPGNVPVHFAWISGQIDLFPYCLLVKSKHNLLLLMTRIFSPAPVTSTAAHLGKRATEMSVSSLRSFSYVLRFLRNLFSWSLISTILLTKPCHLRLSKISCIFYFTKKTVPHLNSFQRVSVIQELKPHFEKSCLSKCL